MFDGKFLGFVAAGGVLYFRSTCGPDLTVLTVPEDCDAHVMAQQLNNVCNAMFQIVRALSNFRF